MNDENQYDGLFGTKQLKVITTKEEKIITIVLLALLISVVFIFKSCTQKDTNKDKVAQTGSLNRPKTSNIDPAYFTVSINSKIYIMQNKKAYVNIKNIKSNSYDMQVIISCDKTGELIYKSDIIKPGKAVENITCEKPMNIGEYKANAEFYALDPKTGEQNGKVIVEVGIVVEK